MTRARRFSFRVRPEEAGMRLDVLVALRRDDLSRSHAANLVQSGLVTIDGGTRKPGYTVRAGQTVSGRIPPPEPIDLAPEAIPLTILYEDRDILVIDKPAGMVVHPAPGHGAGTLVHALLHHCPDLEGIGGRQRPGIVHRLDRDTSGVLVVAKTASAHTHLAAQFKSRNVSKTYLALVYGTFPEVSGTIDMPIGRHPKDRKKMSTRAHRTRTALTEWRVREEFGGVTLLELRIRTGRTHQIRVHCSAIRHPVVGDPVYAGKQARNLDAVRAESIRPIRRQMLHARRIGFTHPRTGERMTVEAPLPEDMVRLVASLRAVAGGDRRTDACRPPK